MNGFDVYKTYQAVKLHFTTKQYNFFVYEGKTSVSQEAFERRRDKFLFHKLARKCGEDEIVGFLVSNFVHKNTVWVRDLLTEECDAVYREWKRKMESIGYVFKQDINKVMPEPSPVAFNELFKVKDGEHPEILKAFLHNDISLETMVILNNVVQFLDKWDTTITDDIVYPKISLKIRKYGSFLNVDVNKYKKILKDLF